MALPIPSSTSSLHLEADHASSSFTFIPSDSDFEDLNHPHSVSHTNSDLGKAFIDFNIEDDTDKNQRYHQQKQQRKTWAPSSLSLKPLRAKPTGRNSLPTVSARKTKTLSNSTISRFVSSLASVAVASSSRLDPTVEETNQLLPGSSPSYRLSSFFFETTTIPISSVKTNTSSPSSSSTTSIDSSTLTSSCTPSATNSTNNKNISTSSISAPTTTTCPGSLSSSPNHQVGQLLFGAPILDDPAFFEKEFHAIINDHQLYRHPVSILHPKQNTHWDDDDDKQQQQQRIDDGFLLLKTMNLQQLYTDCQHVGESTTQWMQDQDKECQDDQVSQLTLEWGYINCHRILEQYNRLLAPETHSGSSDDKKALYSSIRQQLDTMEDDIADEHTMAGLENLVQSLANAIYQGILLTNYGRTVIPNKDYWIEGSNHHHPPSSSSTTTTITSYNTVDHRDEKTTWYPELFAGQSYHTFAGYKNNQPVVLMTLWDGMTNRYMCIYRSTLGPDIRLLLVDNSNSNINDDDDEGYQEDNTCCIQITRMTPEWESALEEAFDLDLTQLVQIDSALVRSSGIEQDLIRLDKDMNHYQFKCGVLYVKDGQYKEDEWFSNNHGSTSFDSFLDCLGEKISLKGYQGWAAGLDTKSGDSGDYTYTSTWQDIYQVTYHISTLIPSTSGDKQHIQKKRHIGNDIVCIVFVDGNKPFDPAAIKSQFLHVFIIVHQEELHGRIGWRVEVTCVKDVPLFGPAVTNQTFYDKPSLHNFLLAKLINAEYAALKAPKFTKPLDRARKGILSNVVERILKMQQNSSNKSGGVKVHNNNSKSSSNNNISKYHVTSLRPSSATAGPTTLLKDLLLSSEGLVGTLGRP